jgi:hypothetical protein
MRRPTSLIKV